MTSDEAKKLIKDALDRINALIAMEKWKEAHRACLEILRFDPENIKVIRIKNKIERVVRKLNLKTLKADVAKLQPLWNEKNYEELVEQLRKLEPYAVDYPKIRQLYITAQKKYHDQLLVRQQDYINEEIERMSALAKENKFEDAVKAGEKLRLMRLDEQRIKKTLVKLRKDWIEYELSSNKTLTESEKYEDILLFYQNLLHIDSKHEKVRKMIEKTKKTYQIFKIQQKKDFIYKQLEKIKTLYQMNRFDQVMNLAEEVLEIDPLNKSTRYYYKKAKRKAEKMADREIFKQMQKSREEISEDYKKDRSKVIKM